LDAEAVIKMLEEVDLPDAWFRRFACWCVRNTPLADGRVVWDLLEDERSRQAVIVAERHAEGLATDKELAVAWAVAWAAAWAAARAVAGAAARAAARAAAGAAARAAARAAAWAAAGAAARAAARKAIALHLLDDPDFVEAACIYQLLGKEK
jgi:hypothetical protein